MHLANDSPPFTPVHSQIRAVGPRDLHLAKGRDLKDLEFWKTSNQQASARNRLKRKNAVPLKNDKKLFDEFIKEARSHQSRTTATTASIPSRDLKTLKNLYNAATSLEFHQWLILVADEGI